MTNQSALQHSFPFTHIHTVHLLAELFSMPKGIKLPTFWLEDDRSTPQPQPPHASINPILGYLRFSGMLISRGVIALLLVLDKESNFSSNRGATYELCNVLPRKE